MNLNYFKTGFGRFLCFLTPFAILAGTTLVLCPFLGYLVVGLGFSIAYCFGEGN